MVYFSCGWNGTILITILTLHFSSEGPDCIVSSSKAQLYISIFLTENISRLFFHQLIFSQDISLDSVK